MTSNATTVRTTYYGPTDFKGSRIVVMGPCGQLTVSYDYAAYDAHDAAVDAYLTRCAGAHCTITTGTRPTGPDSGDQPRRRLTRSGRGYRYTLQD